MPPQRTRRPAPMALVALVPALLLTNCRHRVAATGVNDATRTEEVCMSLSDRSVIWGLAGVALILVFLPIAGVLTMGSGMMGGAMMLGMHLGVLLWLGLTVLVLAAFVALVIREASKT